MARRIKLSQFNKMLMDPEVPEQEIAKYLQYDERNSQPFAPAFALDPARVDDEGLEAAVFLAIFNQASRARRLHRYRRRIRENPNAARIVSEGDSWFQYPLLLDDVIDQLSDDYAILSLGAAGDLLGDMLARNEYTEAIRDEHPAAFLISGGGNDLLGGGKLSQFLKKFSQGRPAQDYLNQKFQPFVDTIDGFYRQLFEELSDDFPALRIFCHGYDYAIPNKGKWLGEPMESRGIKSKPLQRQILRVIIDALNQMISGVANDFPGSVTYVNCRGAVTAGQWHDELHPNDTGFTAVTDRFRAALTASIGGSEAVRTEGLLLKVESVMADQPRCPGRDHFIEDDDDIPSREMRRMIGRQARKVLNAEFSEVLSATEATAARAAMSQEFEKLGLEKVHRGRDFLPARFLRDGARAAEAVCRISTRTSLGSGGLIANGQFIITNNHVLSTTQEAADSIAEFGFEGGVDAIRVPLRPERLFITDVALDFTIVACDGDSLSHIAPLPLLRDPTTISPDARVSIVQHPRWRPKEVALHDNKVISDSERTLRYTTDTEPGSSGSPVFNHDWEFVALHHAGESTADGGAENEGIRMAAITAKLISQSNRNEAFAPQAVELLDHVTDTSPFLGFFDIAGVADEDDLEVEVPSFKGSADFADIGFWNIEHFNASVSDGRVDKVADVLHRLSMDVMGLVEVERPALERLKNSLQQRGNTVDFVVKDVSGRQDLAILFDRETTTVTLDEDIPARHRQRLEARTPSGRTAFPREPLFARCRITDDNVNPIEFLVIVVHLKAFGDAQSRARRRLAATMLSEIIEDVRDREGLAVVIGGDYNHRLNDAVLAPLVDTPDLFAMTADDDLGDAATFVGGRHRSVIDHIVISNDLVPGDIMGDDAAIVRLDKSVAGFVQDISDHVPVVFRVVGRKDPVDVDGTADVQDNLTVQISEDITKLTLSFS